MGGISTKMVKLAEHRAYPAHLEHQPLEDARLQQRIVRPSGALALFCEINEDCTGFEQRERRIDRHIRIDDRRNLVVRVDRQEILTELLVVLDVDRVNLEEIGRTQVRTADTNA